MSPGKMSPETLPGFPTEKSLELVTFSALCKITCCNVGNMMVMAGDWGKKFIYYQYADFLCYLLAVH